MMIKVTFLVSWKQRRQPIFISTAAHVALPVITNLYCLLQVDSILALQIS